MARRRAWLYTALRTADSERRADSPTSPRSSIVREEGYRDDAGIRIEGIVPDGRPPQLPRDPRPYGRLLVEAVTLSEDEPGPSHPALRRGAAIGSATMRWFIRSARARC